MNILIAPDSFKGSLSAKQFCDIADKAIKSVLPNASVIKRPLADGGEGTVEALVLNTNGRIFYKTVYGPMGKKTKAHFGILGDCKTAIIEMASASGLPLVALSERNPMIATTYGTGELVLEALELGCTKMILGIGGSATNDGGAGMMQALGFKLLDNDGQEIEKGAKGLLNLAEINIDERDKRLDEVEFVVACDVDNPLCGLNGAARVYGFQKGANEEMVLVMDEALKQFDRIIQKDLNKNILNMEGAGAAGGLGAGMMAFLDADLRPGFEIINEAINLEQVFKENKIDLVITGEGEINYQTINGKLPVQVAKLAKKYNAKVIAVVGTIGEGADKVYEKGIDSIISIVDQPMSLDYALVNSERLLFSAIERLVRILK
ncbi:MAG: glycerate kinase [Alkaliphilus sp.]|nr:glycerate kinase [bacterium AH-315-G05]MBN4074372.1 glycerate kinase [bacterium AH-315-E09]PHS31574.1 MAG: glycerate kinase [Alkaliphilus sp.]